MESTKSCPNDSETKGKFKHDFVQLRCPLLPPNHSNSITIKLPSDDCGSNLNFILQTIRNKLELVSHMKDSDWLLLTNGIIIDKHNAIQFGEILSEQIPPVTLDIAFFITSNVSLNTAVQQQINVPPPNIQKQSDFQMSWTHVLACIKHEMWPKLASVIESVLNRSNEQENKSIDIYHWTDECRANVMDILTRKKRLPNEECQYLKGLLQRATEFQPNEFQSPSTNPNRNDFHYTDTDRLNFPNLSLLMDIHDVHALFVFINCNFSEYTIDQFKANVTDAFGPEFVEKYETNLSFKPRFNPYPVYIIDDDMSRVFDYHFGISWFVNTLKHNLFIEKNTYFEA
eukprot:503881_1